jgi:hypothetical protein
MGSINTKHLEIVRANLPLLRELDDSSHELHGCYKFCLDPDVSDEELCLETLDRLTRTCWACGREWDDRLTKCHVMSDWCGGGTEPSNFFLLCDYCHQDQPDEATREVQEKWLHQKERYYSRWARENEELFASLQAVRGSTKGYFQLFLYKMLRRRPVEHRSLFSRLLARTHSYKTAKAHAKRLSLLPKMYARFLKVVPRYKALLRRHGSQQGLLCEEERSRRFFAACQTT